MTNEKMQDTKSQVHFISGLPRSGSTLLAAILRQNPKFHAGMTSPVFPMVAAMHNTMGSTNEMHEQITQLQRKDVQRGVIENFYRAELEEGKVVFDTNRVWTSKMPLLNALFPEAKVICCVRDVAWIIDSFERAIQKEPTIASKLFAPEESMNVYTRAKALVDANKQVGAPWNGLKEAFYGQFSKNLMLIELDALTFNPEAIMDAVYDFIGEESFKHDFDNVSYEAESFDGSLGLPGLHKVEGKVEYKPRTTILPPDLFQQYTNQMFWRGNVKSKAKTFFVKEEE